MRIAIVNWTNRQVGGAETYLNRVIPALRADHDVFFWHEIDEPAGRDRILGIQGMESGCSERTGLERAIGALENWRPDVLYVHGLMNPAVEKRLLTIAPAVLFAHNYYGTCITGAKTVKFPVIQPCDRQFGASCLIQFFPRRCGGLSPFTMMTEYQRQADRRRLLPRYYGILSFSEHIRMEIAKHGAAVDRIHRVPSVDDGSRNEVEGLLTDGSSTTTSDRPSRTRRLAFIGRLEPSKGCRVLIKSLPQVSAALKAHIILTIAGDGSELVRCRAEAAAVSARSDAEISFLGWVSPSERRRLLAASDLLVLPSLWPEPHGFVGLEALRQGVPVTAFASGGIPEWLHHKENGTLAPSNPPTVEGLAAAIVICLSTPRIRERTRANAWDRVNIDSVGVHLGAVMPVLLAAGKSSTT